MHARRLLSLRSIHFLWIALLAARAGAVEVTTDASAGQDFLYLTTDVRQALIDDRLAVGAGYAMVTDYRAARHGARASLELELAPVTASALLSWAPAQLERGWLSLALEGSHRWEGDRFAVESTLGVLLRRAGTQLPRAAVPVDQLQASTEIVLEIDERARLGLAALLSFYDPDLAQPALRGLESGLFITVAGKPERFAVSARGGVRFAAAWEFEAALSAVAFADGHGGAWLPRLGVRAGPWGGVVIAPEVEVAIGFGDAARDPLRLLGGLALAWER